MADWRIGGRRGTCAACERSFEDGEPHYSLMRVAEEELAREDLCRACFRARDEAADVVYWRTKHREKKGGLRLDLESIEALFNALEPRVETRLRELRFLLALLLMRKRRLKVVRIVKKDDGEAFAVRRPRRDEELTVYVFELTPERQAELREELVRLFDQPDLSSLDAPPEDDELDDDGLEPESDETGSDGTGGESLAYDPKEDEAEETCAPRATDDER